MNDAAGRVRAFRQALRDDPRLTAYRGRSQLIDAAETSDRACVRFLLARGWDAAAAQSMFVDAVVWRAAHDMDSLLDRPAPRIADIARRINEGFPHGCDRRGRPVMFSAVARLDLDAVLSAYSVGQALGAGAC